MTTNASKPVARHFILPNHSKQHMAACGLCQFGKPQNSRKNLSSKSALLIPTVSTSAFHSTNLFLCSRHRIPTRVAPFSAYKPTDNPQFLQSLWRRAIARNVSLLTLYGGQFSFWTQLITLTYPDIHSHRRRSTVSLETYPLYSLIINGVKC